MADTNFPSKIYFELRYNGNPGVPFSRGLSFVARDGALTNRNIQPAEYRINGTVIVWELNLYDGTKSIQINNIQNCTVTSGEIVPGSNYDYSYSDTIPTYYLNVIPKYSYNCHVYSGSGIIHKISGATVAILYDGDGTTYSGTGKGSYVISATTDSNGDATLDWFLGWTGTTIFAYKNNLLSSGYTVSTSSRVNNIKITISNSLPGIDTYPYRGYLKDGNNGTAIANATVSTIDGYSGTTDSSGYFSFFGMNVAHDPGNKWGDITGVDGYIPFHGVVSSTCSSDITIPVYYLYPDDSLPPYNIDGTKIMTIYDIARLMYDQWNDVSKEIVCRTLNVENVEAALRSLVNKYCNKDSNGTLVDFSGKPSGYCPTVFAWYPELSELGTVQGLSDYVSREVIGYSWHGSPGSLEGCIEFPFYLYGNTSQCTAYANSDFYKMYTSLCMSSITASFNFKNYNDASVYTSNVPLISWVEYSGDLSCGHGENTTTGVSYTLSFPPINRILANSPSQVPLTWRFVIDEGTSIGSGVYPRVLDAKDALEVGNDKFTVQTYTTRRNGNNVSVQIFGHFNMIDFQNDFKFKIPVDTNGKKWKFVLPTVGEYRDGIVDPGDTGTIQLVSSTGTSPSLYATSANEVLESGVFPARTLTTSRYYRQTFANGLYLKFVGSKDSTWVYKYLKATVGDKDFWFDVTYSGYNVFANIISILDTDDYITYDITEDTATVSFGTVTMSWETTKS